MEQKNGKATAGFIIGIISLSFVLLSIILGGLVGLSYFGIFMFVPAIVGLTLSVKGKKKAKEIKTKKGLAVSGLVLNIITIVISAYALLVWGFLLFVFAGAASVS